MTIKLPVAADLLETDARLAWRIVDADGVTVPWGTVVAALNATATAPTSDPSVLRETALVLQQVYEDIVKAADSIDGAMDDLYRHIPDRPVVAALNATAAPDLRLALENVEAILAEACSSPYDEEWKLISDAWSYVKAILAGETLVETESKTAAEILGLPWDDHDPATEIEAAVSAMGYAEVFGEDGTL